MEQSAEGRTSVGERDGRCASRLLPPRGGTADTASGSGRQEEAVPGRTLPPRSQIRTSATGAFWGALWKGRARAAPADAPVGRSPDATASPTQWDPESTGPTGARPSSGSRSRHGSGSRQGRSTAAEAPTDSRHQDSACEGLLHSATLRAALSPQHQESGSGVPPGRSARCGALGRRLGEQAAMSGHWTAYGEAGRTWPLHPIRAQTGVG